MNMSFRRSQRGLVVPRLFLATLVLVTRLIASSVPMPAESGTAQPLDALAGSFFAATICHTDAATNHAGDPTPHDDRSGHTHDCGLCPLCHSMAAPAVLASGAPDLPAPTRQPSGRPGFTPPATGPPSLARAATSPRGPPAVSV